MPFKDNLIKKQADLITICESTQNSSLYEGIVFCWDLDGTIIDDYCNIRPGFEEFLKSTHKAGAIHYITTYNNLTHLNFFLQESKLSKYLTGAYTMEDMGRDWDGKKYSLVMRDLGYSEKQARKKFIIFGDQDFDVPRDLNEIVSCVEIPWFHYDTKLSKVIVDTLLEKGKGNLSNGYKIIYSEAKNKCTGYGYQFKINNQVTIYLKNIRKRATNIIVPKICAVRAPSYERY